MLRCGLRAGASQAAADCRCQLTSRICFQPRLWAAAAAAGGGRGASAAAGPLPPQRAEGAAAAAGAPCGGRHAPVSAPCCCRCGGILFLCAHTGSRHRRVYAGLCQRRLCCLHIQLWQLELAAAVRQGDGSAGGAGAGAATSANHTHTISTAQHSTAQHSTAPAQGSQAGRAPGVVHRRVQRHPDVLPRGLGHWVGQLGRLGLRSRMGAEQQRGRMGEAPHSCDDDIASLPRLMPALLTKPPIRPTRPLTSQPTHPPTLPATQPTWLYGISSKMMQHRRENQGPKRGCMQRWESSSKKARPAACAMRWKATCSPPPSRSGVRWWDQ